MRIKFACVIFLSLFFFHFRFAGVHFGGKAQIFESTLQSSADNVDALIDAGAQFTVFDSARWFYLQQSVFALETIGAETTLNLGPHYREKKGRIYTPPRDLYSGILGLLTLYGIIQPHLGIGMTVTSRKFAGPVVTFGFRSKAMGRAQLYATYSLYPYDFYSEKSIQEEHMFGLRLGLFYNF